MSTLDNILADTRQKIDGLRAESADHAREATALAEKMAEPTDRYRAMEAEERDLVLKLEALRGAMKTARSALEAMADERKRHTAAAEAAANAADHFEQVTLPHFARLLDGVPPAEALAATGLMPTEPAQVIDLAPHVGHDVAIRTRGGTKVAGHLLDADREHARIRQPDDTVCTVAPADVREIQRVREIDPPPGLDPDTALVVHADPFDVPPAPREPVATPPVPTAPAGELVATGPPDRTMPDGQFPPLPAAPGKARHEKPREPRGSRWTGGFKLPHLGKPLPDDGHTAADEQQGDGENGGGQ